MPVALYVFVSSVIAAAAVLTARETAKLSMAEIDRRPEPVSAPRFAQTPAAHAAVH